MNLPTTNQLDNLPKEDQVRPFSSGTGAMIWMCNNCERCVKYCDDLNIEESTRRSYLRSGKMCKIQYYLGWGHVYGYIPKSIAPLAGWTEEKGWPEQCMLYSDNDDDRWRPPKKPKPDPTPDNQVLLFSEFDSLFEEKRELITK